MEIDVKNIKLAASNQTASQQTIGDIQNGENKTTKDDQIAYFMLNGDVRTAINDHRLQLSANYYASYSPRTSICS